MKRNEFRENALERAAAVCRFRNWEAESDQLQTPVVEFDNVGKLVSCERRIPNDQIHVQTPAP